MERSGGQRLTRQLSSSHDSLLPRQERRSQETTIQLSLTPSRRYSRWSSEEQLNTLRDSRLSLHSSPDDSDYEGSEPEHEPEQPARRIPSLRQRSNSIVLEEVEKEEKMKILSVFGMSKSVQKWKNHLWGRLAHTLTSFQNHFLVNGPEDEPEPEPLPKAEPLPEREPAFKNAPATGKSLKKRDLEFCLKRTRFDEKTVLFWFRSFRCF